MWISEFKTILFYKSCFWTAMTITQRNPVLRKGNMKGKGEVNCSRCWWLCYSGIFRNRISLSLSLSLSLYVCVFVCVCVYVCVCVCVYAHAHAHAHANVFM